MVVLMQGHHPKAPEQALKPNSSLPLPSPLHFTNFFEGQNMDLLSLLLVHLLTLLPPANTLVVVIWFKEML